MTDMGISIKVHVILTQQPNIHSQSYDLTTIRDYFLQRKNNNSRGNMRNVLLEEQVKMLFYSMVL